MTVIFMVQSGLKMRLYRIHKGTAPLPGRSQNERARFPEAASRPLISLVFSQGATGPSAEGTTIGPAPWVRISGNFIRMGPHGTIAGTFHMHYWEVNGRHYPRYDCPDPAVLHFEDAEGGSTREFGPFSALYAEDGVLHGDGKLFAKFVEETVLWHCFETETYWPVLIIKPVPGLQKA